MDERSAILALETDTNMRPGAEEMFKPRKEQQWWLAFWTGGKPITGLSTEAHVTGATRRHTWLICDC